MEVNLEHSYWKRRMVKNSIIAESFLILLFLFTNMFFKAAQRLHWVSKTTIIKCILLRLVRGTYANSAVLALYCRLGLSIGTLNRVIRVHSQFRFEMQCLCQFLDIISWFCTGRIMFSEISTILLEK